MKKRPFLTLFIVLMLVYWGIVAYRMRYEEKPAHPELVTFAPYDMETSGKKYPLIVFSHAYLGCPKQSTFLTRGLAKRGFIVVAVRHRDAACGDDEHNKFFVSWFNWPLARRADVSFFQPEKWNEKTIKDRHDDVVYALDHVLADEGLAPFIDKNKIGLMGHSLGGYTVLGVAGAWSEWRDIRVKAVLAFAPYVLPYMAEQNVANINIPVMYQVGSKDRMTPAWLTKTVFHQHKEKTPRHYVELDGAGHFDWMDIGEEKQHRYIRSFAKSFFNQHLRGETSFPLDVSEKDGVMYVGSHK